MYYKYSIGAIRCKLKEHVAKTNGYTERTPEYILWMCDKIETMNEWSLRDARKAARWIGWMFAIMESLPNISWLNDDHSRFYARQDEQNGYAVTHWTRWLH